MTVVQPAFTASGLASGLDTGAIVDGLVAAESQPLNNLKTKESALKTQVSLVGNLASELTALQTAAQNLKSSGILAVAPTSTPAGLTATTTSGAASGRYAIQVTSLAQAAKQRSQGFNSASDPVTGGTLSLSVQGTSYTVNVADGESLSDVAYGISHSGAPVSAVVLNDGTHSYLSVTNTNTGFPVGSNASSALSITETSTGSQGQKLNLAQTAAATNATFTLDGLNVTRSTNTVSDAIPGVTLNLTSTTAAPSDLVLATDTTTTQANLQKFVDAYNTVMSDLQKNLNIDSSTDRTTTLAGNSAVQSLEQKLQGLISTVVVGAGSLSTLSNLGVKTAQDGTLSINSTTLNTALSTDPNAVNSIFTNPTNGIGQLTSGLVNLFTDPVDGLLTNSTTALNRNISDVQDQETQETARIAAYKDGLQAQFAAMETVISGLKSVGNFLTQQEAQLNKSS